MLDSILRAVLFAGSRALYEEYQRSKKNKRNAAPSDEPPKRDAQQRNAASAGTKSTGETLNHHVMYDLVLDLFDSCRGASDLPGTTDDRKGLFGTLWFFKSEDEERRGGWLVAELAPFLESRKPREFLAEYLTFLDFPDESPTRAIYVVREINDGIRRGTEEVHLLAWLGIKLEVPWAKLVEADLYHMLRGLSLEKGSEERLQEALLSF